MSMSNYRVPYEVNMRAWIITGSALGGKYVSMSNYKGRLALGGKYVMNN